MHRIAALAAAFVALACSAAPAAADPGSPVGAWHGSGIIRPVTGAPERAACHASVTKAPARNAYDATIHCNTSLGVISQSARMVRTSGNRYRGTFYNAQYDARGTVSSILAGNRQTVTMLSNKGSGSIVLKR
jgi:hypothetical protein